MYHNKKSGDVSVKAEKDTTSESKSAMISPSVASKSKTQTQERPVEETKSQVKRTERTQASIDSLISTRTTTTSSTIRPSSEIRSPIVSRLKSELRDRSLSMDNVGSKKKEVLDSRGRASTATSSREVGSQATQLGVYTPPTKRAQIGLSSPFSLRLRHHSHAKSKSPELWRSMGS